MYTQSWFTLPCSRDSHHCKATILHHAGLSARRQRTDLSGPVVSPLTSSDRLLTLKREARPATIPGWMLPSSLSPNLGELPGDFADCLLLTLRI